MPDNLSNATPREILDSIAADARIDQLEVNELQRRFNQDWVIDRAEAELLFEINRRVSGPDNVDSWTKFFVTAITKHVVFDMNTPGEVDQDEGDWLGAMLSDPRTPVETALLKEIKSKATLIAGKLADQLFHFE